MESTQHEAIKKSADYIIKRNNNIDISALTDIELEDITLGINKEFILFIGDRKIDLDGFTSISTARFILDNLDKIDYFYCKSNNTDSIVGKLSDFIITNLL